jgi:predicted amidohydrolase YtcJ
VASGRAVRLGGPADLLITGGRVWTGLGCPVGDDAPDTIAMTDGRVAAVGDAGNLRTLAGDQTLTVDVGGRRVVPGLIDSHIHAVRAGLTYLDELDWTQVPSVTQALATIQAAAASRADGSWITALGGWHAGQFTEDRLPDVAELDGVAPRHPVFVHPVYGHGDYGVLNTAALQALGWTGQCLDPPGGVLYRQPDGSPDGRLSGVAAYQQVARAALRPAPAQAEASTRAFFARLAGLGLTGVVDAGGLGLRPASYRAVWAVWRAGDLPVRVRLNVGAATRGDEPAEIAAWQAYLSPGMGDDMLAVLGIGEIVHFGCHDWVGMAPLDISDDDYAAFTATLRETALQRWPLTVHAILDSSVSRVLDAIEEVAADVPVADLRWSLCHAECISQPNLRRVRELGLGLAVQSRLGQKAAVCATRWGEDAVRNGPPLGDIAALGIPFGAGTDSTRDASYNPWQALRWFVTGLPYDLRGPRRAERHCLDRAAALDAYTRGSAWFSFEDDSRGSLVPGSHADLAVLSADYFAVPQDEIAAVSADLTIVGGRIVHACDPFSGLPLRPAARRPAPATAS